MHSSPLPWVLNDDDDDDDDDNVIAMFLFPLFGLDKLGFQFTDHGLYSANRPQPTYSDFNPSGEQKNFDIDAHVFLRRMVYVYAQNTKIWARGVFRLPTCFRVQQGPFHGTMPMEVYHLISGSNISYRITGKGKVIPVLN
jgi:hypothetical protein